MPFRILIACLALSVAACAQKSAALVIPFDFSRHELVIDVAVKGEVMHMLLDTGVDPSVIDHATALRLGLAIDLAGGGEGSGVGDAAHAMAYPTAIEGLTISGRAFAPVDALTADLSGMSEGLGRRLDGVLGFSFLKDKIVLIDYARSRATLLDAPEAAADDVRACRQRWSTPMRFAPDDNTPLIPEFHFGDAAGPVTLDTGSNAGVSVFQSALALPGVRAALTQTGTATFGGFRGQGSAGEYALGVPIGFGPFRLPAGQAVTVRDTEGGMDTRIANVGNQVFAGLGLKMLLDYRARQMTFYGDCG